MKFKFNVSEEYTELDVSYQTSCEGSVHSMSLFRRDEVHILSLSFLEINLTVHTGHRILQMI